MDDTTEPDQLEKLRKAVDTVDLGILCIVRDEALWKTEIADRYNRLVQSREEMSPVSPQTIGRHVDKLQKLKALESRIISPESIRRDLIIAYTVKPLGDQLLSEEICAGCHRFREDCHHHEFVPVPDLFTDVTASTIS